MTSPYADFRDLVIEGPEQGVLTITMDKSGRLNAADAGMHNELAEIWRVVDADPEVNCAIIRGAGKGFSAGGDLDLVAEMAADFDVRARVWREARDLQHFEPQTHCSILR